jgi:hypothetical protein
MLFESFLHEKYAEFLKQNNIPFELDVRILNGVVDFKVDFGGKFVGVQAKADRSNLFSALGQLMNARRTFSDIYLLSTEEFYNSIYEVFVEFGIQDNFGFIILKEGKFLTLSQPKTKEYYFNEKFYKPSLEKKTKVLALDEPSMSFLKQHKDKPFFSSDISKELKISMALAQSRINSWRRFGLIENDPHVGIPKPFRVIKIPQGEHIYLESSLLKE